MTFINILSYQNDRALQVTNYWRHKISVVNSRRIIMKIIPILFFNKHLSTLNRTHETKHDKTIRKAHKTNIDGYRNSFYVSLTLKWGLEKRCFIQICDTPVRIQITSKQSVCRLQNIWHVPCDPCLLVLRLQCLRVWEVSFVFYY